MKTERTQRVGNGWRQARLAWHTYGRVPLTKGRDWLRQRFPVLFPDPTHPAGRLIRRLWTAFALGVGLLVFFFGGVATNFLRLFGDIPGVDRLQNAKVAQASELFTADGVLLGRYYRENRSLVDYREMSPDLTKALVATEDVRFYQHTGVDFEALLSVAASLLRGEDDRGGGSTITQQLAKNLFKTRRDQSQGLLGKIPGLKTLIYKTKEWIVAIRLEQAYTKEEILALYLNTVDFGSNSFGIKIAAKTFFNTTPDRLTLPQSATLVGLLKATTLYSPFQNPENSLKRRNVVLSQMAKYDYIRAATADSLSKTPLSLDPDREDHIDGPADYYFKTPINNYLTKWCEENGYDLYADGLVVYATIDSRAQRYAEEAVAEQVSNLQKTFNRHWGKQNPWVDENDQEIPNFIETVAQRTDLYKQLRKRYAAHPDSVLIVMNTPRPMKVFSWNRPEGDSVSLSPLDSIRYYKRLLQAGMMAMDPYSGHIKAWVGGLDYRYFQYDHVRQAKRQPGSTFKPFVYAAAFEKGYAPCDKMTDQRVTVRYVEKGEEKIWQPRNSDYVFSGSTVTLRRAMARSINTVTAQLTEKIGPRAVADMAYRLGIRSPMDTVPSIGLGSSDVSVHEMVAAYCTFLNQGIWTEPLLLARIEDRNGNVVHQFTPTRQRAISEETAYLMTYMLRGGIEEQGGTSQNLWSFDLFGDRRNEIGGKTGTTSNLSDGWFIGLTKDLVSGVWVGGDDRSIHFRSSALGEGSKTALPVYGRFMEKVYADKRLGITPGAFPKPAVPIRKQYNCPTAWVSVRKDSVATTVAPEEEEFLEFAPPDSIR
ncbi:MAG: transglycosylase domain-containing protein [Ferruginibacter sp.]|nr:transglycosylase domain-containing protein [Cytophagales bacterium]